MTGLVKRQGSPTSPALGPDELPTMLTIAQTEDVLQISRWKVYQLIRSRQLPSVKIGRSRRIPVLAVQTFVAHQAEETS